MEKWIFLGNVTQVERIQQQNAIKVNDILIGSTCSPMHLACFGGHVDMVQYFVDKLHANLINLDHHDKHPLHCAVQSGDFDTVAYLVQKLKQRNWLDKVLAAKDRDGRTPYHAACAFPSILTLLMQSSTTIEAPSDLIVHATRCQTLETIKLLMNKAFSIEMTDDEGKTPLMFAASQGDREIVEFLVSKGATIDKRDKYQRTACDWAYRNGFRDLAETLRVGHLDPKEIGFSPPISRDPKLETLDHILIQTESFGGIAYLTTYDIQQLRCIRDSFQIVEEPIPVSSSSSKTESVCDEANCLTINDGELYVEHPLASALENLNKNEVLELKLQMEEMALLDFDYAYTADNVESSTSISDILVKIQDDNAELKVQLEDALEYLDEDEIEEFHQL